MANRFEGSGRNGFSYKRFRLREIFVGADLEFLGRSPFLDFRRRCFRFVKLVQPRDHAIDLLFAHQILRKQLIQKPAARQFFHFEGVFDDCSARCFE